MPHSTTLPENSELGKKSSYDPHYNPDKLFPIARQIKRDELGIAPGELPFYGYDCWNHYEVSWLNPRGKPIAAMARIIYPCDSLNIIEAKSMKLYFNSFNNTSFENYQAVIDTAVRDIASRIEKEVTIQILPLNTIGTVQLSPGFDGCCLDDMDIACDTYTVAPAFLTTENATAEETVYSNLMKSNCLVTGQPDWGSVQIHYRGKKINHEGFLRYIVSFRNHQEFHEQCIERIFMDIMKHCKPEELTVYGRYTRRGGLDINPYRSTKKIIPMEDKLRLCRQ